MKIIKPTFSIPFPEDLSSACRRIEFASRKCWQSGDKAGEGTAERMTAAMAHRQHRHMLRHANVTVEFTMSRGAANQLVRHGTAAFAQESTRYVGYSELAVVSLDELDDVEISCLEAIESAYAVAVKKHGKDRAKQLLPQCTSTNIVCTHNIAGWQHIFRERCHKAAHGEIRWVMERVREEFCRYIPSSVFMEK